MTNTPPPTSNNNDDAVRPAEAQSPVEPETPVFDEVDTDHPEMQDAAPALVEPEQSVPASEPVPLVEPATPVPASGSSLPSTVESGETMQAAPAQEASTE